MNNVIATLKSPGGEFVKRILPMSVEAGRRLKEKGALVMTVDPTMYPHELFQRNSQLFVEYQEPGRLSQIVGDTLWFLEKKEWNGGLNQPETLKLTFRDANWLMGSRIVANFPENYETEKEAPAQDLILEVLREQMGNWAIGARDLSEYLSIPDNTGLGPTLLINIAWQNVQQVIASIIDSSIQNGTELMVDIQLSTIDPMQLIVRIGELIGTDRRATTRITKDMLQTWTYVEDYTNEATYMYAGGEGDEDDRLIVEVNNTAATLESPFNRVEGWIENSEADVTEQLEMWAKAELNRLKTKPRITGEIISGPRLLWNYNIGFGDWVTLDMHTMQYDAQIVSYAFRYTPQRGALITMQVESL